MVTKEMLNKQNFIKHEGRKASYMVTRADTEIFREDAAKLPLEVDTVIHDFCEKNGFEYVRSMVADMCKTDPKTLRGYINGTIRISRSFLYKLTIGLGLTLEEANKLFEKCGGKLNPGCLEDFIVMAAIEDGDDIDEFYDNFNDNVPKSSKLH